MKPTELELIAEQHWTETSIIQIKCVSKESAVKNKKFISEQEIELLLINPYQLKFKLTKYGVTMKHRPLLV